MDDILRTATDKQLEQAAAFNHTELFYLNAMAMGGEIKKGDGISWTYGGPGGEAMLAFPVLQEDTAGEQLDEIMQYYLQHPPKGAGCWSLYPAQPADLGIRLLARGFQPGWRPCWMGLDLEQLPDNYTLPKGLQIKADNAISVQEVKKLPNVSPELDKYQTLNPQYAGRLKRFIALLDGKIVAHSTVVFTTGPLGAAGIYHVGVVPAARNKGIGKAVSVAACLYAKERGYRYAVLNATDMGRRIYEQIGFKKAGDGDTWWLITPRFMANPPNKKQVALSEAIGRGDVEALDLLSAYFANDDFTKPITNGMTLMQLAVHCKQPAAAKWLLSHGVPFRVLEAWDLGWKDQAAQLLVDYPAQVNDVYGEWGTTLLHEAAHRSDVALAKLALSAHPDLGIRDRLYQSTALDWARHLQQEEIVKLIEAV